MTFGSISHSLTSLPDSSRVEDVVIMQKVEGMKGLNGRVSSWRGRRLWRRLLQCNNIPLSSYSVLSMWMYKAPAKKWYLGCVNLWRSQDAMSRKLGPTFLLGPVNLILWKAAKFALISPSSKLQFSLSRFIIFTWKGAPIIKSPCTYQQLSSVHAVSPGWPDIAGTEALGMPSSSVRMYGIDHCAGVEPNDKNHSGSPTLSHELEMMVWWLTDSFSFLPRNGRRGEVR